MDAVDKRGLPLIRVGRRLLRHVRNVPLLTLLTWGLGFALGALTNIYPLLSLIVFGLLTLVFAIVFFADMVKAEQPSELSDWELTLRDPDKYAAATVARANEHFLVIGQAIEVLSHPNLNTRASIEELGWDPAGVQLNDLQEQFDTKELLDRAGGYKEFDPPNGIKFSLSGTSFVTLDSPALILDLRRTNYFTIKSVLPAVKENPELRAEFGNLNPASNRIPHSLCLHYIVRFSGGDVLCMRRDPRAAYHGNLWSFSGEEQLSESDFMSQFPGQSLFRRTFCEEVLALRDESPLAERWEIARDTVKIISLWSVFVEERIFNFSLLGVYQLRIGTKEFISIHNELIDRGMGSRDCEGDFFVVSQDMLRALLFRGKCNAKALFTEEVQIVRAEDLHPTSRYRVFRLLRAVHRKPLQPEM